MDEGPELFVALGGEVGVVQLMRRAVKAEAHQAEDADDDTVDFIKQPALAQQPVRRLVKADQHAVHEMAGDQDQRRGEPVVCAIHGEAQRRLREEEQRGEHGERGAAEPMRRVRFDRSLDGRRGIHHSSWVRAAMLVSGERQAPASRFWKMRPRFSTSASGKSFGRKSHTTSSCSASSVISQAR